ncbi:MAG: DUF4238 domain-containing protein [Phycisphaeraceae bacterium]|nr:MAG: DUF4238 domain-containing protein [Phycisphaeraceae bacterium]
MGTNVEQHFVPQQLIRRFANEHGRLYCLRKDTLEITNRDHGNLPHDILKRKHYYKGLSRDADDIWLKPIETAFGKAYRTYADMDATSLNKEISRDSTLLRDWALSLYCRTEQVPAITIASLDTMEDIDRDIYAIDRTGFINEVRYRLYQRYRHICSGRRWRWQCVDISRKHDNCFVLTDHPVCATGHETEWGFLLFVPITKRRLIVGGDDEGLIALSCDFSVSVMNSFSAACANRLIYSSTTAELEDIASTLMGKKTPKGYSLIDASRQPFFGANRITEYTQHAVRTRDIFSEMASRYWQ